MKGSWRDYVQLVRGANLFTAVADVVAGYSYASGRLGDWRVLLPLAVASTFLYAGGVALNDLCDVHGDAVERPTRPIPSGRVSGRGALRLVTVLFLLALPLASIVSLQCLWVATALIVCIVAYDTRLKATPFAPAAMGMCRALNLMLGMVAAVSITTAFTATHVLPLVLMWLYVTSLTFFARGEAVGGSPQRLVAGTLGVFAAVVGLSALRLIVVPFHQASLGLAALLAFSLGVLGLTTAMNPTPARVQRSVKVFVIAIIGFDACIAWSSAGPLSASVVALLIVPTVVISRWAGVT